MAPTSCGGCQLFAFRRLLFSFLLCVGNLIAPTAAYTYRIFTPPDRLNVTSVALIEQARHKIPRRLQPHTAVDANTTVLQLTTDAELTTLSDAAARNVTTLTINTPSTLQSSGEHDAWKLKTPPSFLSSSTSGAKINTTAAPISMNPPPSFPNSSYDKTRGNITTPSMSHIKIIDAFNASSSGLAAQSVFTSKVPQTEHPKSTPFTSSLRVDSTDIFSTANSTNLNSKTTASLRLTSEMPVTTINNESFTSKNTSNMDQDSSDEDGSLWAEFLYVLSEESGQQSILLFSLCALGSAVVMLIIFFYSGLPLALIFNFVVQFFLPADMHVTLRRLSFAIVGGKVFFSHLRISTSLGVVVVHSGVMQLQWWKKEYVDGRQQSSRTHRDGSKCAKKVNGSKSAEPNTQNRKRVPFRLMIKCHVVEVILVNGIGQPNKKEKSNDIDNNKPHTANRYSNSDGPAKVRHWLFKWLPSVSYEVITGCVYIAPPHLSLMWAARFQKAEGILLDLDYPSSVKMDTKGLRNFLYKVVNKIVMYKVGLYLMPTHDFDTVYDKKKGSCGFSWHKMKKKKKQQILLSRRKKRKLAATEPINVGNASNDLIRNNASANLRSIDGKNGPDTEQDDDPMNISRDGSKSKDATPTLAAALRSLYQSTLNTLIGGKATGTVLSLKEKYAVLQCKTIDFQYSTDRLHVESAKQAADQFSAILCSNKTHEKKFDAFTNLPDLRNRLDIDINESCKDDTLNLWIHPLAEKYRALTLMHFFPRKLAIAEAAKVPFSELSFVDQLKCLESTANLSIRLHSKASIFVRFEYNTSIVADRDLASESPLTNNSRESPLKDRAFNADSNKNDEAKRNEGKSMPRSVHYRRNAIDTGGLPLNSTKDEVQYINGDQRQLLGNWLLMEVDAPNETFLMKNKSNLFVYNPAGMAHITPDNSRQLHCGPDLKESSSSSAERHAKDNHQPQRIPYFEFALPKSRLFFSNMPLCSTIEMATLDLRLETYSNGLRFVHDESNDAVEDEAGIVRQNLNFSIKSTDVHLLNTHLVWLVQSMGAWGELFEDQRLRDVFSFERTIWDIKGNLESTIIHLDAGTAVSAMPFDDKYGTQLELEVPKSTISCKLSMLNFNASRVDFDIAFCVPDTLHVFYCPHISHPFRRQTGFRRLLLMQMSSFLLHIRRDIRATSYTYSQPSKHVLDDANDGSLLQMTQFLAVDVKADSLTIEMFGELLHAGLMVLSHYIGVGDSYPVSKKSNHAVNTRPTERSSPRESIRTRAVHHISLKNIVCLLPTHPLEAQFSGKIPMRQQKILANFPRLSFCNVQIAIVNDDDRSQNVQATFQSALLHKMKVPRLNHDILKQNQKKKGMYLGVEARKRSFHIPKEQMPNSLLSCLTIEASKLSYHGQIETYRAKEISSEFKNAVENALQNQAHDINTITNTVQRTLQVSKLRDNEKAYIKLAILSNDDVKNFKMEVHDRCTNVCVGRVYGSFDLDFLRNLSSAVDTISFAFNTINYNGPVGGFFSTFRPAYNLRLRLGRMTGLTETFIRKFRVCAMVYYAGQVRWISTYDLMLHANVHLKVEPEDCITNMIFQCFSPLDPLKITIFTTLGWKCVPEVVAPRTFRGVQVLGEIIIPSVGYLAKHVAMRKREKQSSPTSRSRARTPSRWKRGLELVIKATKSNWSRAWWKQQQAADAAVDEGNASTRSNLRDIVPGDVEAGFAENTTSSNDSIPFKKKNTKSVNNSASWMTWNPSWWHSYNQVHSNDVFVKSSMDSHTTETIKSGSYFQSHTHRDKVVTPTNDKFVKIQNANGFAPLKVKIQLCVGVIESAETTTKGIHFQKESRSMPKDNADEFVKHPPMQHSMNDCSMQCFNHAVNESAIYPLSNEVTDDILASGAEDHAVERPKKEAHQDLFPDPYTSARGNVPQISRKQQATLSLEVKIPCVEINLRWHRNDDIVNSMSHSPNKPSDTTVALTIFKTCGTTSILFAKVSKHQCGSLRLAPCTLIHANRRTISVHDNDSVNVSNMTEVVNHGDQTSKNQEDCTDGGNRNIHVREGRKSSESNADVELFDECIAIKTMNYSDINVCLKDASLISSNHQNTSRDDSTNSKDSMPLLMWQLMDFNFNKYRLSKTLAQPEQDINGDDSDYESIYSQSSDSTSSDTMLHNSSSNLGTSLQESHISRSSANSSSDETAKCSYMQGVHQHCNFGLRECIFTVHKKYIFHADLMPESQLSTCGYTSGLKLKLFEVPTLNLNPTSRRPASFSSRKTAFEKSPLSPRPLKYAYDDFNKYVNKSLQSNSEFNVSLDITFAKLKVCISEDCIENLNSMTAFVEPPAQFKDCYSQLLLWYMRVYNRDINDSARNDDQNSIPALKLSLRLPFVETEYYAKNAANAFVRGSLHNLRFKTQRNDKIQLDSPHFSSNSFFGIAAAKVAVFSLSSFGSRNRWMDVQPNVTHDHQIFGCNLKCLRAKQSIGTSMRNRQHSTSFHRDSNSEPKIRTRLCGCVDTLDFNLGDHHKSFAQAKSNSKSSTAHGEHKTDTNGEYSNHENHRKTYFPSSFQKSTFQKSLPFDTDPYSKSDVPVILVLHKLLNHFAAVKTHFVTLKQSRLFVKFCPNLEKPDEKIYLIPRTELIILFVQLLLEYEQRLYQKARLASDKCFLSILESAQVQSNLQLDEESCGMKTNAGHTHTSPILHQSTFSKNYRNKEAAPEVENDYLSAGEEKYQTDIESMIDFPDKFQSNQNEEKSTSSKKLFVNIKQVKTLRTVSTPVKNNKSRNMNQNAMGDGDDTFALTTDNGTVITGWSLIVHLGRLLLIANQNDPSFLNKRWLELQKKSHQTIECPLNLRFQRLKTIAEMDSARLADRLGMKTEQNSIRHWVLGFDHLFGIMHLDHLGYSGGNMNISRNFLSASKVPDDFSFNFKHISGKFWIQTELQKIFLFEAYNVRFMSSCYSHNEYVKIPQNFHRRKGQLKSSFLMARVSSLMCTVVPAAVARVEKLVRSYATTIQNWTGNSVPLVSTVKESSHINMSRTQGGVQDQIWYPDQYTALKRAVDAFSKSMQRLINFIQNTIPGRASFRRKSNNNVTSPGIMVVFESFRGYLQGNTYIGWDSDTNLTNQPTKAKSYAAKRTEVCAVVEIDNLNLSFNAFPRPRLHAKPHRRLSHCFVSNASRINVHFNGFRASHPEKLKHNSGGNPQELSLRLLVANVNVHAVNTTPHFLNSKSQSSQFQPIGNRVKMASVVEQVMSNQELKKGTDSRRSRVSFAVSLGRSSLDVAVHLLDFSQVHDFVTAWLNVLRLHNDNKTADQGLPINLKYNQDQETKNAKRSKVGDGPLLSDHDRNVDDILHQHSSINGDIPVTLEQADTQTVLYLDVNNWSANISLSPQLRLNYELKSVFTRIVRQTLQHDFAIKVHIGPHYMIFGRNRPGKCLNKNTNTAFEASSKHQHLSQVWVEIREHGLQKRSNQSSTTLSHSLNPNQTKSQHQNKTSSFKEDGTRQHHNVDSIGRRIPQIQGVEWCIFVGPTKNRFHLRHLHQLVVLSETLNNEFLIGLFNNPVLFPRGLTTQHHDHNGGKDCTPSKPDYLDNKMLPFSGNVEKSSSSFNTLANRSRYKRDMHGQHHRRHHHLKLYMKDMELALVSAWHGGIGEIACVIKIGTVRCIIERRSNIKNIVLPFSQMKVPWVHVGSNESQINSSWLSGHESQQTSQWTGRIKLSQASSRFVLPRVPLNAKTQQKTTYDIAQDRQPVFYDDVQHIFAISFDTLHASMPHDKQMELISDGVVMMLHPVLAPALSQFASSVEYQKRKYEKLLKQIFSRPGNEVSRGIGKFWSDIRKRTDAQLSDLRKYFRGHNQVAEARFVVTHVHICLVYHQIEIKSYSSNLMRPPIQKTRESAGDKSPTKEKDIGTDNEIDLEENDSIKSLSTFLQQPTKCTLLSTAHLKLTLNVQKNHLIRSASKQKTKGSIPTTIFRISSRLTMTDSQLHAISIPRLFEGKKLLSEMQQLYDEINMRCSESVMNPIEQLSALRRNRINTTDGVVDENSPPSSGAVAASVVRRMRRFVRQASNSRQTLTPSSSDPLDQPSSSSNVRKVPDISQFVTCEALLRVKTIKMTVHSQPSKSVLHELQGIPRMVSGEKLQMKVHLYCSESYSAVSPLMTQHLLASAKTLDFISQFQKLFSCPVAKDSNVVSNAKNKTGDASSKLEGFSIILEEGTATFECSSNSICLIVADNLLNIDASSVHKSTNSKTEKSNFNKPPRLKSLVQSITQSGQNTARTTSGFSELHIIYELPTLKARATVKYDDASSKHNGNTCYKSAVSIHFKTSEHLPQREWAPTYRADGFSQWHANTDSKNHMPKCPELCFEPQDFFVLQLFLKNVIKQWQTSAQVSQISRYSTKNMEGDKNTDETFVSRTVSPWFFMFRGCTLAVRIDPFVISFRSETQISDNLSIPKSHFGHSNTFVIHLQCISPLHASISCQRDSQQYRQRTQCDDQNENKCSSHFNMVLCTDRVKITAELEKNSFGQPGHYTDMGGVPQGSSSSYRTAASVGSKFMVLDVLRPRTVRTERITNRYESEKKHRDNISSPQSQNKTNWCHQTATNLHSKDVKVKINLLQASDAIQFLDVWLKRSVDLFQRHENQKNMMPSDFPEHDSLNEVESFDRTPKTRATDVVDESLHYKSRTYSDKKQRFVNDVPAHYSSFNTKRILPILKKSNFRFIVPTVLFDVDMTHWLDSRVFMKFRNSELFIKSNNKIKRVNFMNADAPSDPYGHGHEVISWISNSKGLQVGSCQVIAKGRLLGHVSMPGGFAIVRMQSMLPINITRDTNHFTSTFSSTKSGLSQIFSSSLSSFSEASTPTLSAVSASPSQKTMTTVTVPISYTFGTITPSDVELYHCLHPDVDSVLFDFEKTFHEEQMMKPPKYDLTEDLMSMVQASVGCVFIKWRQVPMKLLSKRDRNRRSLVRCLRKEINLVANATLASTRNKNTPGSAHVTPQYQSLPVNYTPILNEVCQKKYISKVIWGNEMVIHFDSILCSGHAQTYSSFRAALRRSIRADGLPLSWSQIFLTKLTNMRQLYTKTHRLFSSSQQTEAENNHVWHKFAQSGNEASFNLSADNFSPDHTSKIKKTSSFGQQKVMNSKINTKSFLGEVRLVVLRSQCEFVDRNPNRGIVVSLGNIVIRTLIDHDRKTAATGGINKKLSASFSLWSNPPSSIRKSKVEEGDIYNQSKTAYTKHCKLEIVVLTAALRYRVGSKASSTMQNILTLPNCKLRMLTEQLLFRLLDSNLFSNSQLPDHQDIKDFHKKSLIVNVLEYVTQWESHLKLATDIRLYDDLRVIFSNLAHDLRSDRRSRSGGSVQNAYDTNGDARRKQVNHNSTDTEYHFDECNIELNPQVDVLKGLTPRFDQVLEKFGSSTLQFISSTDSIVRRSIERLAELITRLSELMSVKGN